MLRSADSAYTAGPERPGGQAALDGHVCPDDITSRAVVVRSAADHQQVHLALVRRQPGRLDDVHGVLSDPAVRRLCVRPSERKVLAAAAGRRWCIWRCWPAAMCDAADRADVELEVECRRGADLAHFVPAGRLGRTALFRPFGDGSFGAGLVLPLVHRPLALPAVCHCRISARCWRWSDIRFTSSRILPSAGRRGCGGRGLCCSPLLCGAGAVCAAAGSAVESAAPSGRERIATAD